MTPQEHLQQAEELLAKAAAACSTNRTGASVTEAIALAEAHIHLAEAKRDHGH